MKMFLAALAMVAAMQAALANNRPVHSFSTSQCKTATCFAKHPSGAYVHPNAGGGKHWKHL